MPKPIGPKKKKKIRIKQDKKRAREAEARAQLVGRTAAEEAKLKKESEILGRQRVKRPERNPKRPNRFSNSGEPPIPPPQLLDAIHEFLADYRYVKAAHGMRTDHQNRPGHSQEVWKWTSKGLPFLSDIFIQWKEQNPDAVQQAAVERKRWLEERERWKAETNEAKRQKKELKRKRRDMAVEAARLEVEKDFDAVARMRKEMRKAEKEQQRLDGHSVTESENDGEDDSSSDSDAGEIKPGIPEQTNRALESGSESDDESEADDDQSDSDSVSEDDEQTANSLAKAQSAKSSKLTVNGTSTTPKTAKGDDGDKTLSSDSSSSLDEKEVAQPTTNGVAKSAPTKAASPSSSSSSSDEEQTRVSKPVAHGTKRPTTTKAGSPTSSSSSSRSSSGSESDSAPPAKAIVVTSATSKSKKRKAPASSSSSSSDSDSDNTPPAKPAAAAATAAPAASSKKRKAPASSSSSSSSSSDTDSDASGGAPLPKKAKLEPPATTNGDAITASASSPEKHGLGKGLAKPFSRIPDNVKVDKKFASNDYVPYDYAQKAYNDLSVVRGKNFTKEKNKKKRGQGFRGGYIDVDSNRAVKFED